MGGLKEISEIAPKRGGTDKDTDSDFALTSVAQGETTPQRRWEILSTY